jgi:hypothetical protein
MNRYALVGLLLTIAGILGVGLVPYFGMATGFGGPLVWKSPRWALVGAWVLAWLVSIAGAIFSLLASRSN